MFRGQDWRGDQPGPHHSGTRDVRLADVALLEPATVALRQRVWESFCRWFGRSFPGAVVSEWIALAPPAFIIAVVAYGNASFEAGTPLLYFRQLIAHIQSEYPLLWPYVFRAWQTVSRWEVCEPIQHRPPLPEPILQAIAALGASWAWPRWVAVLLGCFYSIARIGEFLQAKRADVLLPKDLLSDDKIIFVKVRSPKTRRRGPTVQYVTIDAPCCFEFLCVVWGRLRPDDHLYNGSAGAFRTRWDATLARIGIPKCHRLTPGSLRAGGAVAAHRRGKQVSELLRAMRLQQQKTLAIYLQGTTAFSVLPALPETVRSNVQLLKAAMPAFLEHSCRGPAARSSAKG